MGETASGRDGRGVGQGQDHAVRQREELHWKLKENE